MDIKSIIAKKRIGGPKGELSKDEIKYFIGKWVKGEIKDSQAAALMSYIYTNGLTEDEIVRFVIEVGNSGDVLDLNRISANNIDIHSTGGVGDKVTLILLPVIAALGIPVAKVSSKGLGISRGAIDKLDTIPGFNHNISIHDFEDNVENIGLSIINQGLDFAPAESKMYQLRNDISCRDSIVLMAISLMSLKIATGSQKIVFDISCGKGTYIDNREDARRLGKLLVRIGNKIGKKVGYAITLMEEPVGKCIGNILEIKETVEALNGKMTKDVQDEVVALASIMLNIAFGEKNFNANAKKIMDVIQSGQAMTKFKQMVIAQGGNADFLDNIDKFPKAKLILPVRATNSGYISKIDADMCGSIARYIGAGRMSENSEIDNTAGIVIQKKIGSQVQNGEILAYVHLNDEGKAEGCVKNLADAFQYSIKPLKVKSKMLEMYGI